jgi:predicted ATPase
MNQFVQTVSVVSERVGAPDAYPFSLPAVRALMAEPLALAPVTYVVGENGSGKSTILEALAVAMGFNAEGGTKNFNFATRRSESPLHGAVRLGRGARRPQTGFFLRAESFFNLATEIENLDREFSFSPPVIDSYGGKSLHEQSHGESFLSLFLHRFGDEGFYILDEPEAALSPQRQLAFLVRLHELVRGGSQFVIATHSPIVLAYPGAVIYRVGQDGVDAVAYDDAEPVTVMRDFLGQRERYVARLLADTEDG